jgi:FtsP/CotA-like multicopper oxidase with cupredoxin domain
MPLSRRALLLNLAAAGISKPVLAASQPSAELRARSAPQGTWRFNGSMPGPLLRARQGEEFRARVYNELSEAITVHWHGVRLPNSMDGTLLTQAPIAPGRHFDYVFAPPDAGTFWYRADAASPEFRHHHLFGFFLVSGQDDGAYFDLPLLLDETLRAKGSEKPALLVNGRRHLFLAAPRRQLLRLRLLNAGARGFRLALAAARAWIIAHDGQPSAPVLLGGNALELWPGQRLDIACLLALPRITLSALESNGATELASITPEEQLEEHLSAAPGRPAPLNPNPLPDYFNYAALHHVSFTIEGGQGSALAAARYQGRLLSRRELTGLGKDWAVNGHAGLAPDPLFSVPRGTTVAVTVDNITRSPHVLHIHGHAARLVEESGRAVERPVWRDTLVAFPLKPAKILFIADNPGRWLIASAVAEHRQAGLASWFEVT